MMQGPLTDHDLYSLLGIHPTASPEEIRSAYRRRAMMWHPDRNRDAEAEETFKRIRSAYAVLRDRSRRADRDHDAARHAESAPTSPEAPAATVPREPDVRRRVTITLDEQLRGGRVELQVTRTEYCAHCKGSGTCGEPAPCAACGGAGYVRPSLVWFPLFGAAPSACTECAGGGVTVSRCAACDGNGTVARKRGRLRFEIPGGIPPGGSLRVRGHGRRGRGGRAPGDLLISVAIASHPLFVPEFPHLRCDMPISVFRVLAGGAVEVPTLDHPVALPLPAGLADGTELRIAGHGMLNGATGKRGDLLVRLRLIRPRALSGKQHELLAELERLAAHEPAQVDWLRRRRAAESIQRPDDRRSA